MKQQKATGEYQANIIYGCKTYENGQVCLQWNYSELHHIHQIRWANVITNHYKIWHIKKRAV